ncbi:MAG: ribonuclease [Oceanotoga sp.]|nr:ribonuclease [Oceanotoga sp.]
MKLIDHMIYSGGDLVVDIEKKIIEIIKHKPVILKKIYELLQAENKEDRRLIRKTAKKMLSDGIAYKDSKNKYHLVSSKQVVGTIEFTKSGNMAFLSDKNGDEIAITVENSLNAMHKDRVLIEKIGQWRDLPSGRVIRILNNEIERIVGQFQKKKMFGFVIPLNGKINYDFYISPENMNNAKEGEIVEVEILKHKSKNKNPEGKIIKILGKPGDPSIDLPIIITKHGLPNPGEFPKKVMEEALKIPEKISKKEFKGRKDFRDQLIFTIDGDTAKDFDDAVGLKKLNNGNYELGVHIADVSHYVNDNSDLNKEAYKRSTSIYLINTVIPMLPHELSDWICSLVQDEDRLTMSLIMEINKDGDVVKSNIYNGIINSKKRLTYSKANKILENNADENLMEEIGFLKETLESMKELMYIIRENRKRRGSILDIESGEVYFEFDENGYVKDILKRERGISEKIIEEFMIKANETVAEFFDIKGLPFIYRVHENPDGEMLIQLKNYLEILGIKFKIPETMHPKVLQEILEKTKDHPLNESIQKLLVRSMKRAIYSNNNIGHFGLASNSYTHFTSPIRRYPDLIVHKMLKKYIEGKNDLKKQDIEKYSKILPDISESCSKKERVADEAEWDLIDMKKIEYIRKHIGEKYEVFVTGVTKFGLFVEIPEKMINGLIHISELDDYFIYNERDNSLVGDKTKKTYRVGDKIKAVVVKADKLTLQVDFIPYENYIKINKKNTKNYFNKKNKNGNKKTFKKKGKNK